MFFEVTFTSFAKIKSHKVVTKQQQSRFFLLFLLDDINPELDPYIVIRINRSGARRPKNIQIRIRNAGGT
jgi:hypothetical protein